MDDRDSMQWARRGGVLAVLVIGWVFIAWQNRFHITAPLVFVCLGFLAVVATIYNLWRTGAAAVAVADGEDDSTWAKPAGALGELERERRTLLKAIKEAEFDHQMGKLSQRDADGMIATYKARIYEVYGEIDKLQLGAAGSKREQILREVRARIEVDARSQKKPGDAKKPTADKKAKKKLASKAEAATARATADNAAANGAPSAELSAAAASAEAEVAEAEAAEAAEAEAEADDAEPASDTAAAAKAAAKAAAEAPHELEADSTTALEASAPPARDKATKEATP